MTGRAPRATVAAGRHGRQPLPRGQPGADARRGGGTAKGPKPRDYEYHLPKQALRSATRMAILSKLRDNEAIVIEDLAFAEPKTKEMAAILKSLNLAGATCLIGTDKYDVNAYKSARNIDGVAILPAAELNTYIVLRHKRLILTRAALEALRKPAARTEAAAPPA